MKAISIQKYGDPSGMKVIDAPEPVAAPGQLLIAVEAIGVGGVDAVIRRGTIGSIGFPEGLVPGSEVAGRVIAAGDPADKGWIGRTVWAFTGLGGGYAEQAVAGLDDVTPLPEGLSPVDAVTIGSSGPVAHFGLAHAHFAQGESVLVRGAAGSIGILAVQMAALGGAREIAVTTSSPERGQRLRELGATVVLDRAGYVEQTDRDGHDSAREGHDSARDGREAVRDGQDSARNGHEAARGAQESERFGSEGSRAADGFDVIVDLVGGDGMPVFLERLADNGRMVSLGVVGGYPPADFGSALLRSFRRSLSYGTLSLDTVPVEARNRIRERNLAAAARGELRAVVHDVLPLPEASDAHRRMDAGEVFGRIVLTV
ncbi:zinc-binding dehydrogenase [Actinoplanes sp. TRM 88003]|uniref:Zinc-binding dehydrogenase n=1 Tax=Paractinoplanes aksuensis TaxID=2939490 RepID=A0ABT1DG77_9ACTN|nr:zinc-binding dehydrogenase [Actinoplanes aksuensis]MCO8269805.1 zinc-binding dehydrogenase [Actinoplanes aksuensis]